MNLNIKKKIVFDLNKKVYDALSMVIANYLGTTAEKITELRKISREKGVYIKIVKNKLMHRIIKNTPFECLKSELYGTNLIALSHEHPNAAARLLEEFEKKNVNFKIKSASFEGKIIPASKIYKLSMLPTYEEAIIKFLLIIKEISVKRLIFCLVKIYKNSRI